MNLPKYKCHKVVQAGKILRMDIDKFGNYVLDIEDAGGPITVTDAFMHRHRPQVGGYYVRYEDGYESFSPAKAFENGYTRIEEEKN